jgi:Xaa-Pro aminopeptidase
MDAPPGTAVAVRLQALRQRLEADGIDALVVTKRENVRYLSGFTGTSGALRVASDEAVLITDTRYAEQAGSEAPAFALEVSSGAPALLAAMRTGKRRVGFEADALWYELWHRMREAVEGKRGGVLIPCHGLVEIQRARKDAAEVARIERAAAIAAAALEAVRPMAVPGAAETDLALEIEFHMRRAGAESVAFDLIVASGPRAALPHGRASGRRLQAGEFVVFDIGARFEGYHSDMTRTLFTGRPGPRERALYDTVLAAQDRAIGAIRPGVAGRVVDEAARTVIAEAGHSEHFGHGTGHGVGLEVHESPRIGSASADVLETGMVVTVEPGVYLPGECGLRIEDMALVVETGCRMLTPRPESAWWRE